MIVYRFVQQVILEMILLMNAFHATKDVANVLKVEMIHAPNVNKIVMALIII
jgi:hypothetical protein